MASIAITNSSLVVIAITLLGMLFLYYSGHWRFIWKFLQEKLRHKVIYIFVLLVIDAVLAIFGASFELLFFFTLFILFLIIVKWDIILE